MCHLQLVDGMSTKEELQDLCRLLDFLAHEINGNSNFEFVQALLRLVLQVSKSKGCLFRLVSGQTCSFHAISSLVSCSHEVFKAAARGGAEAEAVTSPRSLLIHASSQA